MKSLLNRTPISDVIQNTKAELTTAFRTVTNSELQADPVGLAGRLIERFSLHVPILDIANKHALVKEVQVDVSGDPQRHIWDRSRPFCIAGTEVKVIVPFEGDAWMFDVQPTMFTLNPPFAEVRGSELQMVYRIVNPDFNVEADADRVIGAINQYLQSLRGSAEQLKIELQQQIGALIEQRKRERSAHGQIIASLKIPVKQEPEPQAAKPTPKRSAFRRERRQPRDEWDVFISHAREDKDAIATPLAEALRSRGLSVWYDDFSLLLGDSLRESIDKGLASSRYGIVILSGYFFAKRWPQQELNGLVTRELDGKKVILPVWHGVDFNEVRSYSPTLADRLAVRTNEGLPRVIERIVAVVESD